uniref:Uncharacterized protein n=1 Tax=Onchocerca volvulus TaxID=6282 RepID=A0A8R1XLW0_ONCVO
MILRLPSIDESTGTLSDQNELKHLNRRHQIRFSYKNNDDQEWKFTRCQIYAEYFEQGLWIPIKTLELFINDLSYIKSEKKVKTMEEILNGIS